MPIISGLNNEAGKVVVIDESDWSVEFSDELPAKPTAGYTITGLTAGNKLVVFIQNDGEVEAYGGITAAVDPA